MWLSKPVYEALPYYYLAAGLIGLIAGLFVDYGYWAEICFVAGFAALVAGLAVLLKRRDYRSSRSRMDFDEIKRPGPDG